MSTLNDVTKKNVLEAQSHNEQQTEKTFEDKETLIVGVNNVIQKNKHRKRNERKKEITVSASGVETTTVSSTNHNVKVPIVHIPIATQFSIERSDSDGCLRMKISAIRPNVNAKINNNSTTVATSIITSNNNKFSNSGNNNNNNSSSTTVIPSTAKMHKIKTNTKKLENKTIKKNVENIQATNQEYYTISNSNNNVENNLKSKIDSKILKGESQSQLLLSQISNKNPCRLSSSPALTTDDHTNNNIQDAVTKNNQTISTAVASNVSRLNEAADSGCSEGINHKTITATKTNAKIMFDQDKGLQRVRTKRKKYSQLPSRALSSTLLSSASNRRYLNSMKTLQTSTASTTDSEDEPLSNKLIQKNPLAFQKQQKAPRLLLTAISNTKNSKNNTITMSENSASIFTTPTTNSNAATTINTMPQCHNELHISLSSSDNELPDLVSAVIKRVVGQSDEDDDGDADDNVGNTIKALLPKCKSRRNKQQQQQYQSTLLQDFMEKTQMLGGQAQTKSEIVESLSLDTKNLLSTSRHAEILAQLNTNSQSDSMVSTTTTINLNKKRRGRPKKLAKNVQSALVQSSNFMINSNSSNSCYSKISSTACTLNINESADSGVISTTSASVQSSSPQSLAATSTSATVLGSDLISLPLSPSKSVSLNHTNNHNNESSTSKPKIDIGLLDKRMYATERVLYPPPRNKRRQSINVPLNVEKRVHANNTRENLNNHKDEVQLDPIWRQIDVNRKFRRPSVASTSYKSDYEGEEVIKRSSKSTICSKVLAAKSGYTSDYGGTTTSLHSRLLRNNNRNTSGYKSDASGKSRYSIKTCVSRRSRAKSCGYRSDCKESGNSLKSSKFRRKRRTSVVQQSMGSLKDEQDILQLAGLSLGQSSEESNEYVCKPSLEKLPTTSASKKYGEINRYIATGEYFGRGSSANIRSHTTHLGSTVPLQKNSISNKLITNHRLSELRRKNSITSEYATDIVPLSTNILTSGRKIKSRRSSIASYCSSYYSGITKVKRRRRRKTFRFLNSVIDSKLLTEIDILTNTFASRCRIHSNIIPLIVTEKITNNGTSVAGGASSVSSNSNTNGNSDGVTNPQKEKLLTEANKLQQSLVAAAGTATIIHSNSTNSNRREARDKRNLKKRKTSENLDFAMLSANAAGINNATAAAGSNSKRRHKKTIASSSPDDHKLPLKKRHYLLTPGEKSNEVAAAVAAKLFANNTEAWAAAAAAAKTTASTKSQQQFHAKTAKANLTPKKRHLLQQTATINSIQDNCVKTVGSNVSITAASSVNNSCHANSPLRITIATAGDPSVMNTNKFLDISPHSLSSLKQNSETVNRKRSRLECFVSKISTYQSVEDNNINNKETNKALNKSVPHNATTVQIDCETSCPPPPGIFEPSVQLEIQIPSINNKVSHTSSPGIITKVEVDSPLLLDSNRRHSLMTSLSNNKCERGATPATMDNVLNKIKDTTSLKRKRKKINRTGFPTVRRRKRKINKQIVEDYTVTDKCEQLKQPKPTVNNTITTVSALSTPTSCDRVPRTGETSDTFLERNSRTPRLSVVALERLQETPGNVNNLNNTINRDVEPYQTNEPSKQDFSTKETNPECTRNAELNRPNHQATSLEVKNQDEEDDKPLMSRIKRTKVCLERYQMLNDIAFPLPDRSSARKSRLTNKNEKALIVDSTVKLPAGLDPNINFSCKIRLKRRPSIRPNSINQSIPTSIPIIKTSEVQIKTAPAEMEIESVQNDVNITHEEHDILPLQEMESSAELMLSNTTISGTNTEATIIPSVSANVKKFRVLRKTYLTAGLFSDYFKVNHATDVKKISVNKRDATNKDVEENEKETPATTSICSAVASTFKSTIMKSAQSGPVKGLLLPPPYCEKYYRRTQFDFELPYNIWWAYKNSKLPSRITVPSWNFRKIRTNIYADSVKPPNIAPNDRPMCNCKPDIGCGDNCLNRMVYTECSPANCPTREKCQNQKIQRHEIAPGVERFMTTDKGWGVRTKQPIIKGTYILEYVGEVVTEREFKERMATIYLNDNHHYCLHLDGGLVIDGHRMGSDCRFVNHSCQPNCEMQKWSVNGLSRMALFAKRNIEEGEELTYDYNFSLFNPSEGQPCRCNTPQCRGVIGGKSQRVKPVFTEFKTHLEMGTYNGAVIPALKEDNKNRQRKRTARRTIQSQTNKDIIAPTRIQPLNEKEKKLRKQYLIFLLRNLEKAQRNWCRKRAETTRVIGGINSSGYIQHRRSSTPATLATQISALCTARQIKTRGLSLAVQDPEVEKMAKMAKIFKSICTSLEELNYPDKENGEKLLSAISQRYLSSPSTTGANKRKKSLLKIGQKQRVTDLKVIQGNIEQGFYKVPSDFNNDVQKVFNEAKEHLILINAEAKDEKLRMLKILETTFQKQKEMKYKALYDILQDDNLLRDFKQKKDKLTTLSTTAIINTESEIIATKIAISAPITTSTNTIPSTIATGVPIVNNNTIDNVDVNSNESTASSMIQTSINAINSTEDIISCICGLYKDEGLMIQCSHCLVWQHTECTKADVNAENYLCEKCEPRVVDYEIPLDEFTEDGHRYYLTLMRGSDLQVRQGDAVYVLRDIPLKDDEGNIVPMKKHTYETIKEIDYNECDIFRVERLWKDNEGKRLIFGHHFLRPHETFHEPSRKFYPNEVVRVPLYEVVPIELVIGRCWVLDRTTFCKGRPIECIDESHCFICELRVDKQARLFSKAKMNYPTCTKSYAFRKFNEKLRISKTYAPHEVDTNLFKSKKSKMELGATTTSSNERNENSMNSAMLKMTTVVEDKNDVPSSETASKNEVNRTIQCNGTIRKHQTISNPRRNSTTYNSYTKSILTMKQKRLHLENVLKVIKEKQFDGKWFTNETSLNLSYLLTGRGARRRKSQTINGAINAVSTVTATTK